MTFAAALFASFRREVASIRSSGWDMALVTVLPLLAMVAVASVFIGGVFHKVPVVVVDADHSALSRGIVRNLSATPKIRVALTPTDLGAAWSLMRAAKAYAVIYIPPGLERTAVRHESCAVVVYFNAALQTVASQAADAARDAAQAAISGGTGLRGVGETVLAFPVSHPRIEVTIIGNAQGSFEPFLEVLAVPLVLNLLLSCATVFAVGREFADGTISRWSDACGARMLPATVGKLGPYILAYWFWCLAWVAYLAGFRGWRIEGALPILVFAQLVLFCSTGAISVVLAAVTRNLDTALSLSALYAGSGLAFAGATLPLNRASWLARIWSAVLPSTSYVRIQQQQWLLGSPLVSAAGPYLLLFFFIVIPLAVGSGCLSKLALSPPPMKLQLASTPTDFAGSLLQTLRQVLGTRPVLTTVILSVVLYGFYYPSAYKEQTVIKLPVALVDLDRSPLSRSLVRNLAATREISIVAQLASVTDARDLLIRDRVDGVIIISSGLERSVLRGTPGGVNAFLKGAYLVRSRFLGQALAAALKASVKEALKPLTATSRASSSVETIERPLYNTDNGYGDYTVPGVASIILQATLLFGVAMFVGLKSETGAWRLTPPAFFGALTAFTVLGSVTSFFFFGFVLWFQDYPRGGDLPGLLLAVPTFCACVSAMGMLIGSFFGRHERSMQILSGTSIPIFFVSGLSWPAFAMPPLTIALAKLLPSTTAVLMFVRLNSMGASIGEIIQDLLLLSVLTVIFIAGAYVRLTGSAQAFPGSG